MIYMYVAKGNYNHPREVPDGEGYFLEVPSIVYDGPISQDGIRIDDLPDTSNFSSNAFDQNVEYTLFTGLQQDQTTANATEYFVFHTPYASTRWTCHTESEGDGGYSLSSVVGTNPWTFAHCGGYGLMIIAHNGRDNDGYWSIGQPLYYDHPIWQTYPLTLAAAKEYYLKYGWCVGGQSNYYLTDLTIAYIPPGDPSWRCNIHIDCDAVLSENGEVTIEAHRNGELIERQVGWVHPGENHWSHWLSTEKPGTYSYHCVVVHELDGEITRTTTETITVNVVEYDFDNYDPDTGIDSTGTLTPGSMVPVEPDTPDEPDTPEKPVVAFDLNSWLIGYTLGVCGKPLPVLTEEVPKEPVAYLYNGVRLPPLPEWDKEAYPYAHITMYSTASSLVANLSFTTIPVCARPRPNGGGKYDLYAQGDCTRVRYTISTSSGEVDWTYRETRIYTGGEDMSNLGPLAVIWSNHNINHEDGAVYFAECSDPTPLYE